jgi:hypothetical protein
MVFWQEAESANGIALNRLKQEEKGTDRFLSIIILEKHSP